MLGIVFIYLYTDLWYQHVNAFRVQNTLFLVVAPYASYNLTIACIIKTLKCEWIRWCSLADELWQIGLNHRQAISIVTLFSNWKLYIANQVYIISYNKLFIVIASCIEGIGNFYDIEVRVEIMYSHTALRNSCNIIVTK